MRAGRVITGVALVTLALVARAAPVAACSCVGPAPDPAAALAQADGAFVGTLVGVDDPGLLEEVVSSGRDVEHRFAVEGVAKGDIGASVVVVAAAEGASCGIEMAVGQRAGLLLARDGGRWRSGLCSKLDPDALAALSTPPRADPDDPPSDRLVGDLAAAAALSALTIGAVALIEARTRHDPAPPRQPGS